MTSTNLYASLHDWLPLGFYTPASRIVQWTNTVDTYFRAALFVP
jgi:hypothetical protein